MYSTQKANTALSYQNAFGIMLLCNIIDIVFKRTISIRKRQIYIGLLLYKRSNMHETNRVFSIHIILLYKYTTTKQTRQFKNYKNGSLGDPGCNCKQAPPAEARRFDPRCAAIHAGALDQRI